MSESGHAKAAVWVRAPAKIRGRSGEFPLVFIDRDGTTAPCPIAMNWAHAHFNRLDINSGCRAWTMFLNYVRAAHADFPIAEDDLSHLVFSFLDTRYCGTAAHEDRAIQNLSWSPASYEVVKSELILIASILDHAVRELGYVEISLSGLKAPNIARAVDVVGNLAKSGERPDFFKHLQAARLYWLRQRGPDNYALPSKVRRSKPASIVWQCFTTAEVWRLVTFEKNVMYRALWLAAGFGGPRISELLNTWQADILPPSARRLFFPNAEEVDDRTPTFLRAHPSNSKYTGNLTAFSMTRSEYLATRYGLTARNLLSPRDPMYAGWKGTVPTGAKDVHQIMWCNDAAADAFAQCMIEIREFHHARKTSLGHPYLFVNIGHTQSYGEPIKMSMVKKTFAAACRRVGITPYADGRNIHGLRHHYTYYLKRTLELGEKEIQIAMGHRNIASQQKYGIQIAELNESLKIKRSMKNADEN